MRASVSNGTLERQEELQLLSGMLKGDASAGQHFFHQYDSIIELCVRKVLQRCHAPASEEDVRDMVHDIWLSLIENDKKPLRRFDPSREIRVATWIGLLARNKTIDRLRTTHGRTVSISDATSDAEPVSRAPLPHDDLEDQECRSLATMALEQLRSKDRCFLEEWYVDDRDPQDLAHQYGISISTVYSRRFKIQERLARVISRLCRPRGTTLH